MQGIGKFVSPTQHRRLICFSWLYQCNLQLELVLSFKVFVGELYLGNLGAETVMLFPQCISGL